MLIAYKKYWQNYFKFLGLATRSDYWWTVLMNYIIYVLFSFMYSFLMANHVKSVAVFILLCISLFSLVNIVPSLAIHARRYRDAGISPLWLWFIFGGRLLVIPVALLCVHNLAQLVYAIMSMFIVISLLRLADFIITLFPSKKR